MRRTFEALMAPDARVTEGVSGGPRTSEYCTIRPITPFYRIYFDDGTYFDYDGDQDNTRRQIAEICEADLRAMTASMRRPGPSLSVAF